MNMIEGLQNVQFVVDNKGNKKAAVLDVAIWEQLIAYFKEDATEELLTIPNFEQSIEQAKKRMQAGQFVCYEDIKREV